MNRNKDFLIKAIIVVLAILLIGCGLLYLISSINPIDNDSSVPAIQTQTLAPDGSPVPNEQAPNSSITPDVTNPEATSDGEITDAGKNEASPSPSPTLHPTDWDYDGNASGNMPYPKDKKVKDFPYYIKVNKSTNVVTVLEKDEAGAYTKIKKTFLCSVGRKTPTGTFHLQEKYYWKSLIHNVWGQYSTRITSDVLFHSIPYDAPKKDHLIIHYYNQLGSTASAGCVRLTTQSARWIVKNCPTGTAVEIYYGKDMSDKRPTSQRLDGSIRWDPTDPDTRNPWNTKESQLFGVMNQTIERGENTTTLKGVYAFDATSKQTSTNISVETDFNYKKPGSYPVIYSYTDSKGNVITKEVTFTVKDTKAPVFTGLPKTYYVKDAALATKDKLLAKLRVTDNGDVLKISEVSAEVPKAMKAGSNRATFQVTDAYQHTATFVCTIVLDTTAPTLSFQKNLKMTLPITTNVTAKWAQKRIIAKDDLYKMTENNLSITTKKQDWGYLITYKAKDGAGNTTTIKETVDYETYQIQLPEMDSVVPSVEDEEELIALADLVCEQNGKLDISDTSTWNVKATLLSEDDVYYHYKVVYTATYRSPVGKRKVTAETTLLVAR